MADLSGIDGSAIDLSGIDWEDAFSNAAYIPNGMAFPARWQTRAAAFRDTARARLDLAYGDQFREQLDLFLPDTPPIGLCVFIHGGFWLDFDKSSWSDLAAGPLANGWAVALPSYTLAPEARLSDITAQIGQAITYAAGQIEGPICLAGHSAGGHLATRMVCKTTPLRADISARIQRVVSISGVHDLRPLQLHTMNEKLRLDEVEARSESPALLTPKTAAKITSWVGALERPEFLRQSALLREAWDRQGVDIGLVVEPDRHHFDVIDGLKHADHPLTQALVGTCA